MFDKTLHATLVPGTPEHSLVTEYLDAIWTHKKAAMALAEKVGSSGFWPTFEGQFLALVLPDDRKCPKGWKIQKSRNGPDAMVPSPSSSPEALAAQQLVRELPAFPLNFDMCDKLGIPTTIEVSKGDDLQGSELLGIRPFAAGKYLKELVIRFPDFPTAKAEFESKGYKVARKWNPPPWMRVMTEGEWAMLQAKAKLAQEKKAGKRKAA